MEEITGQVFSVCFRQASNINHDKKYTPPQMNRAVNSRQSDFNESNNDIGKERDQSQRQELLIKLLMIVLIRLQKCTRFNIKPAVK
jgi:hypothetical protein